MNITADSQIIFPFTLVNAMKNASVYEVHMKWQHKSIAKNIYSRTLASAHVCKVYWNGYTILKLYSNNA